MLLSSIYESLAEDAKENKNNKKRGILSSDFGHGFGGGVHGFGSSIGGGGLHGFGSSIGGGHSYGGGIGNNKYSVLLLRNIKGLIYCIIILFYF